MALLSTSSPNTGFTLIEIIITLGMYTIIAGSSISFSLYSMQKQFFEADVSTLVQHLKSARAQSLGNENGVAHGVHITNGIAVLFSGDQYDPHSILNQTIETHLQPDRDTIDIIFLPTTGFVAQPTTITLHNNGMHMAISLNAVGTINP